MTLLNQIIIKKVTKVKKILYNLIKNFLNSLNSRWAPILVYRHSLNQKISYIQKLARKT